MSDDESSNSTSTESTLTGEDEWDDLFEDENDRADSEIASAFESIDLSPQVKAPRLTKPSASCVPPSPWFSKHQVPNATSHFSSPEDFIIKKLSAEFNKTANNTVQALASGANVDHLGSILKHAPVEFVSVLSALSGLGEGVYSSVVSSVFAWGVSDIQGFHALRVGKRKGADEELEMKKKMLVHYVTSESLVYLMVNDASLPPISLSKEVAKPIEEAAFAYLATPAIHNKHLLDLDKRNKRNWGHIIGILSSRGRNHPILSSFLGSAMQAAQSKDYDTASSLFTSVKYVSFSPESSTAEDFTGLMKSLETIDANFKPLLLKKMKGHGFLVMATWLSGMLHTPLQKATSWKAGLASLFDKVAHQYKKAKTLDGAILAAVILCLRMRLGGSGSVDKLKPTLTQYYGALISAAKTPGTRCLAFEGIFRVCVGALKGPMSEDDVKQIILGPLVTLLISGKLASNANAIDALIDIVTVLSTGDCTSLVDELLLPYGEGASGEGLVSSILAFVRIWEKLSPDGTSSNTVTCYSSPSTPRVGGSSSSSSSSPVRGEGQGDVKGSVGHLVGAMYDPAEELDCLVVQRKEIVKDFADSPIVLNNSGMRLAKFNDTLSTAVDHYKGILLPADGQLKSDTGASNIMSILLLGCRTCVPAHVDKMAWFGMMGKFLLSSHALLKSEAIKTLKCVIKLYPDLRNNLFHVLFKQAGDLSPSKIAEICQILAIAQELLVSASLEQETANRSARKDILSGETRLDVPLRYIPENFEPFLVPLLCHGDVKVRLLTVKCLTGLVDLATVVYAAGGEEEERAWLMGVEKEEEKELVKRAEEDRALLVVHPESGIEGGEEVGAADRKSSNIVEIARNAIDSRIWVRFVGEWFSVAFEKCMKTFQAVIVRLFSFCSSNVHKMETMKETAEDKLIRSIWGTALPAVVAVAGVIVEDGFAAQSGEEFAPKTIIDFLWACLLNDSKAVRLVGETAFSFLPKALFFPVTEDLVEMAESPAALAKRVGKKAPDRQFTSYLLTYVWRVLSHNMVGKKVLMSSAFKALREKVLAHLTRWAVNETLRLGPHEDFSLSYRIRYNLCCLIEDLATEINFLSKIAPIGFDTQTILGPVVHEACFVFLLEATLYSPSGQEIRSQEAVALASKKEVHHKADTAKSPDELRDIVTNAAFCALRPLLKLETTPESYVSPFLSILPSLLEWGNQHYISMAFRLSTDLFQHLKDVALSNAVAACLAMSYDSREAVALGYFKILLRFLEMKKPMEKDLPLHVLLTVVLYKLGHAHPEHRDQAILAITAMSVGGLLPRRYIAAQNCWATASYKTYQLWISTQICQDIPAIAMPFWKEAYQRLACVVPCSRDSLLRCMTPWLSTFKLKEMNEPEANGLLLDMLVITKKFKDLFARETEGLWLQIKDADKHNLQFSVRFLVYLATRDRSADIYELVEDTCVFMAKDRAEETVNSLVVLLTDIELSHEAQGGQEVADWGFALKASVRHLPKETVNQPQAQPGGLVALTSFKTAMKPMAGGAPAASQKAKEEKKEKQEEEIPEEKWNFAEVLLPKDDQPLSKQHTAIRLLGALISEVPKAFRGEVLTRVLVGGVAVMDVANDKVWKAGGRLVGGLLQWLSLSDRPEDDEVWGVIRKVNKQTKGSTPFWTYEDSSKTRIVVDSGKKLSGFVKKVTSILSHEIGESFSYDVAEESLRYARCLPPTKAPHLINRCLQTYRALITEVKKHHMAMLLGLWYGHVVNRIENDYSVSLEIMLTIMKVIELLKMGGGGENAAEFPELFWCGVSALHTDIEHELLVALVLMKTLISGFGLDDPQKSRGATALSSSSPSSIPEWIPSFTGVLPLVLKGLMSKVTEETAKSTLLAIADCPYHPFLHGDNHLLYLSVGFAPYLCREACALEKTRFNVVPKAISETSQNVCSILGPLCKEAQLFGLTGIFGRFTSETPNGKEFAQEMGQALVSGFFPQHDLVIFGLLRDFLVDADRSLRKPTLFLFESLLAAAVQRSYEMTTQSFALFAPLLCMLEGESGETVGHVLSAGVRSYVKTGGKYNFTSFINPAQTLSALDDFSSDSLSWNLPDKGKAYISHSQRSSLQNYIQTEPDLQLMDTIPPLPGHLSAPYSVQEGTKNYFASNGFSSSASPSCSSSSAPASPPVAASPPASPGGFAPVAPTLSSSPPSGGFGGAGVKPTQKKRGVGFGGARGLMGNRKANDDAPSPPNPLRQSYAAPPSSTLVSGPPLRKSTASGLPTPPRQRPPPPSAKPPPPPSTNPPPPPPSDPAPPPPSEPAPRAPAPLPSSIPAPISPSRPPSPAPSRSPRSISPPATPPPSSLPPPQPARGPAPSPGSARGPAPPPIPPTSSPRPPAPALPPMSSPGRAAAPPPPRPLPRD